MLRTILGVTAVASLLVPQAPSLDNVLSRAGEYVVAFHQQFRMMVAEEGYHQLLRNYGVASGDLAALGAAAGEASGQKVRKMRSEFALMADPGGDWHAFRDVFEVDGQPLRDGTNRLERAFVDSPATAFEQARRLASEAGRYNLGMMRRNVNVPTFALMTLLPAKQKGFAFTKKGEKKAGASTVWVVAFTETERPTLAATPDGKPLPMRGELWIEPASGRVVRTQVIWDSLDAFEDMKKRPERYTQFPRVQIDVTYGLEPRLDTWVPTEMKELYDRQVEVVTCTATYSKFRRFETEARLVVPK